MQYLFLSTIIVALTTTSGFLLNIPTPSFTTSSSSTSLDAHHVMKKATKGHNAYRPKKHRPSDKVRKPTNYDLPGPGDKPEAYTEIGMSTSPVEAKVEAKVD
ncbi:hypothetical protein ScalyP_jg1655 [Parmales sp. scaly parma]|jgi:hypothetical protein|nr:hypothetical protein ScalyP_jg1655 [Parmales sp. scaly parma]